MPIGPGNTQPPEAGPGAQRTSPAPAARDFYIATLKALDSAGLDYLVGGGHALGYYTGIERLTNDFDIFVRREDYERIMAVLAARGYHTELSYPHWLGKASCEHGYVDVIFNSGNGVSRVDDDWFRHAAAGEVLGMPAVRVCPAEEMIWSKAYIMERERNDSADIMHLLHARAEKLDWARLLQRFGSHWRVLFAHLCLFGFVYPSQRRRIPDWVMTGCLDRLRWEMNAPAPSGKVCQGTLLSREQYLVDIERWGFADVRRTEASTMTPDEIILWTQAIGENEQR